MLKETKQVKKFLKGKGDPLIRKMIKEGGIPGAEKTFNEILKQASQPLLKRQKESLKG